MGSGQRWLVCMYCVRNGFVVVCVLLTYLRLGEFYLSSLREGPCRAQGAYLSYTIHLQTMHGFCIIFSSFHLQPLKRNDGGYFSLKLAADPTLAETSAEESLRAGTARNPASLM